MTLKARLRFGDLELTVMTATACTHRSFRVGILLYVGSAQSG